MIPLPQPSDPRSLKKFFKEYENLTTMEQAQLVGRSAWTIRKWKRIAGIPRPCKGWSVGLEECPFKKRPKNPPKPIIHEEDRSVWHTREWLYQKYVVEGISRNMIARIIKRSCWRVDYYLKQFNIPKRGPEVTKSRNPCCNKEWIVDHYVTMGLSIIECAKLANISHIGFYYWLVRFQIPIRERHENWGVDDIGATKTPKTAEKKKQYASPIVMSA